MSEIDLGANIALGQTRGREEQIEFRKNQTFGSRLCEYITGMRPDNPGMAERLVDDRKVVLQKYDLPDIHDYGSRLAEYENELNLIMKKKGIDLKEVDDLGENTARIVEMFEEREYGYYETEGKFVASSILDRSDEKRYRADLQVRCHEMIHTFQFRNYPNMPIEGMEYEATIVAMNPEALLEDREHLEVIFEWPIMTSVRSYYKTIGKERGEKAVWDTAEWWLKTVDGIEASETEIYNLKLLDEIDRNNFEWNRRNEPAGEIMKFLFGNNFESYNQEQLRARLKFDHAWVRERYGLPAERGENLREYVKELRTQAEERGIVIGTKKDYLKKYGREMTADGYCDDDEPLVFLKDMPEDDQELKRYVGEMEHELVHAWQVLSGQMGKQPQELMEYMALVGGNLNLNLLEENLDSVRDNIFAWGMLNSLERWYERNKMEPPWNLEWWKEKVTDEV
jgi:hypothetical protein